MVRGRVWVRVRYRFIVENHTHNDKRTLKITKTFKLTNKHLHIRAHTSIHK